MILSIPLTVTLKLAMDSNPKTMRIAIERPDPAREFDTQERCRILESWAHMGDTSASIARATVAPGVTTQLHRLLGVDERYLVIRGTGMVRVGELTPEGVGPGDVVAIPAGTSQQISNVGEKDLVFYCICTPPFAPDCYESLE